MSNLEDMTSGEHKHLLSGMYQEWFLDYASYVILERAVPYTSDGLKPVQRRILHAMKSLDDGRYNKVANIVGHTMQYHPHGDASIGDALVQLGQKNLLVDTQGNWGNIYTGDGAAAPRYIEARLSKFALEVLFNPKTTDWKLSYDGRNKEPITLPVKFPLLLAQGVEGIAVGLSSRILPHNFNELLDASIAYLRGEDFQIYPDFLTQGLVDVSKYNDGERGGSVKVRSRIEKLDNKTLVIRDLPYGKTTTTVIDSILKANEKGKIKIKKVDDNTAKNVEILVYLAPGVSSDKTIDALYAFTDCEVSISPNCCVIRDNKPYFLKVSDVLKENADDTLFLLKRELEIQMAELQEQLHFASLERIFISERIYKDAAFEEATSIDLALDHIDLRLTPFKADFVREVIREDLLRLMEIKMGRILKFNADKADELMAKIKDQIKGIKKNLAAMVPFTIKWFEHLKAKYGAQYPRRTEIRSFDAIDTTKVVEANEKLYINREEGFIGTDLKKDEFVCNCSDLDDVIIFYKDGRYKIVKVSEKMFVGKNIEYLQIFRKNDTRTIYNVVYRDGKDGLHYIKRFNVTGITRDKEYDITQGKKGSRLIHFSANPNGEAEVLKITFKPKERMRTLQMDKDFAEVAIKGRASMGNILTKNEIHRIAVKERGGSTLGGLQVWFDEDVHRLNTDGRGRLLGEFHGQDQILVVLEDGSYYTTGFSETIHFERNIRVIEKFDAHKIWTAIFYDGEKQYTFYKRFKLESTKRKVSLIGEHPKSHFRVLTDVEDVRFKIHFAGDDSFRMPLEVDTSTVDLIKCKGQGKRLPKYQVGEINVIEPESNLEVTSEVE